MAGALLVGSLYILFGYRLAHGISILPAAKQILEIEPFMPQVLLAAFCFLVGSLYITGLEGIVDWLHRKMALRDFTALKAGPKGWVLRSIAPLSDSARRRIKVEAARFYRQYAETCEDAPTFPEEQSRFVDSVIAETLWMEGKLAGTPLLAPYEQYRSEGELRLGSALILPLVAVAASFALGGNAYWIGAATLVSVPVALKLADYGLYYFRRAHSFLAHHISDGTVLAPSMEALKRASTKYVEPSTAPRLTQKSAEPLPSQSNS
jgi:hypothetical protein